MSPQVIAAAFVPFLSTLTYVFWLNELQYSGASLMRVKSAVFSSNISLIPMPMRTSFSFICHSDVNSGMPAVAVVPFSLSALRLFHTDSHFSLSSDAAKS